MSAMFPDLEQMALEMRRNYDGRDPNLSEDPNCNVCLEKPGKLCSRCHLVPYCSPKCQREDYVEHKKDCKKLEKYLRNMEKEAEARMAGQFGFGIGPPENAFEKHVGKFWVIIETRDYMRARLEVVDQLEYMNWHLESKRGWDMIADHMQDMLRLSSSDNLEIRYRFPFVLINLNRDDDAYCFIRYWMDDYDSNYEVREKKHERSQKGDWLYLKEEGARFGDILQEVPDNKKNSLKYASLALLVASAIIKMRVVAALEAKQLRSDGDYHANEYEKHKKALNCLLDLIDSNNSSMLLAMVNPGPLREAGDPGFEAPGHPSEALSVLNNACRPWVRIPGAEELLRVRVGNIRANSYNTNMS